MLADDRHGEYGGDTFIRGSKYFKGLELEIDVFGGFFFLAEQSSVPSQSKRTRSRSVGAQVRKL